MPPRATALTLASALTALAPSAQALGIGRLQSAVTLGQPLELAIPVRLEAGDAVEPGCVHAEVLAGESRWGQDLLRARLEPVAGTRSAQAVVRAEGPGQWLLRVTSSPVVDEPVLEVTVALGCDRRFSRRFTVLADPAGTGPSGGVPLPAPAAPAPPPSAADSPPSLGEARPAARPARPARPRADRAPAAPGATVERPLPPASTRAQAPGTRRPAPTAAPGARLLLEVAPPQLKLDIEEPVFMPAPAAEPAASESETVSDAQRLAGLERTLRELQKERQAGQDTAAALRAQMQAAQTQGQAVPWLAVALALAMGVAGWLAWRLRRQSRLAAAREPAWWADGRTDGRAGDARAPAPAVDDLGPVEFVPPSDLGRLDEAHTAPARPDEGPRPFAAPTLPQALAPSVSVDLPAERTVAELPRLPAEPDPAATVEAASEAGTVREVSVEELLDLEQQADFFIALGQEDAAIDLLMSHLRSTGGMSPLPYTKLLEIYHRQNDPDGYERIRTRFNRRFNAYAPDWAQGPVAGRHLEDYPEVIERLQACWDDPVEAMALLEAMLFRRADANELFDLPAYRDVLLLYALARDVAQHSGIALPSVDVLLPLACDSPDEADGPLR
ncbi:FimV family protein [Ideonella sp.]|uniref:type IV pilus assembly protein FimV n=1 Tax=Ideonella sp. TaxID=1929293 RepID=UPI0035B0AC3B